MRSIFFICAVALLAGCAVVKTAYLMEYDTTVPLYNGTDKYHENGMLDRCRLTEPTIIDGFVCIDWIHLSEEGCIEQFEVARPFPFAGISVPVGSIVFFYEDEPQLIETIMFSRDVEINELIVQGGTKIMTSFHKNGRLRSCFLDQDTNIQGIPCKADLFNYVSFYPTGRLESCKLSTDITLQGIEYKKGTDMHFEEDGSVSRMISSL